MSISQKKGSYGGNHMPGEGDAMAQYVQTGERTLGERARAWLKFLVRTRPAHNFGGWISYFPDFPRNLGKS